MSVSFDVSTKDLEVCSEPPASIIQSLKLFQPEGLILKDDSLDALDCERWPASGLDYLILKTPRLSSIKNIAHLEDLRSIHISSTRLQDLGEVYALYGLRGLDASFCPLQDLDGIEQLRELTSLSIDGVPVNSLEAVGSLIHLESLSICKVNSRDTSFLTNLTNLIQFKAAFTPIPWHHMPCGLHLDNVTLSGWAGSDCAFLAKMPNLIFLDLDYSDVGDYRALGCLRQLQHLDLRGSSITDVGHLRTCASLCSVDLRDTGVVDLTPLESCPQLYEVRATGPAAKYRTGTAGAATLRLSQLPQGARRGSP